MPPSKLTSQQEGLLRVRWKARTDLLFLAREILGYDKIEEAVHLPVINKVQRFYLPPREEREKFDRPLPGGLWDYRPAKPFLSLPGSRRRLILDPRGHFKTTINVICHSIQWMLNYPDISILIVHAKQEVAEDILGEIRRHFTHNQILRDYFPEACPTGRRDTGNRGRFTIPSRVRNLKEPSLAIASVDTAVSGYHYDVIKFTDIVDLTNSGTADQCRKVIHTFGMYRNVLSGPDRWMDVEGTCYDYQDLYNRILEEQIRIPVDERRWDIHVRGCYKKDTGGLPYTFLPEERALPDLKDKDGNPIPWFPSLFPVYELESMRKDPTLGEYLFACTPGPAPVLMSDWTEKPIQYVNIGDELIGFSTDSRSRLERSIVKAKGSHQQFTVKLKMESGAEVFCTPDHLWYTGRKPTAKEPHRKLYEIPAAGRILTRIYDPLPAGRDESWSWLGGIVDGEGHVNKKASNLAIHQSLRKNSGVCKAIQSTLDELGLRHGKHARKSNGDLQWNLNGGRNVRMRLAPFCRGKRDQIIEQLWFTGRRLAGRGGRDRILSIEQAGFKEVFWLETSTGNYISQGYASKNCQQLNDPVSSADSAFPRAMFRTKSAEEMRRVPIAYKTVTVDTAETIKDSSDFTVILTCGWDAAGRCYVLDMRRGRFKPDQIIKEIFDVFLKFRPISIRVEETGFVRGLKSSIRREEDLLGLYLPFLFIPRDNQQAKQERILLTLQPWYQKGEIFFSEALDTIYILQELTKFPKYKDDVLDALADQFQGRDWFGRNKLRSEGTTNDHYSSVGSPDEFKTYVKGAIVKAQEQLLEKGPEPSSPDPYW